MPNLKEAAKALGISQPRASKLIKEGKLKKSVKKRGRSWEVDLRAAKKELRANLDPAQPIKAKIGGKKRRQRKKEPDQEEKQETAKRAGTTGLDFSIARALNEQFKAALKKLEYEERTGKLVPAQEVKAAWIRHIAAAKVKLLGIRAKITPIVRDLVNDREVSDIILEVIENEINDTLVELQRSKL